MFCADDAAICWSYGELGVGGSDGPAQEWERKREGEGLAILLERSSSASRARLERLLRERYPEAGWYVHEPVDFEIHRQAASPVLWETGFPLLRSWIEARVIVSLDADFIGTEPDAQLHIRQFARGRRLRESSDAMNRLYAVERFSP
jgi:hypothetical protein